MVKIQVKVIGKNNIYELEIPTDIPISQVKSIIQEKCGLTNNSIRLIFQGSSLKDEETLAKYNVKDGQKISVVPRNSNVREDPPPPQIIPEVPNTTQPQSQSQTIFLNGFRKDLINTGKSLNKISAVTSKLQIALNDSSDVVNASKEFEQVHNSMISQISTFLNSLQGKKFVLNGSAFEIEDTNKRKPVVGDILTKEEKEEIIQQSAGLESYINSNTLHESFLTSSLSKALDAN